MASTKNGVIYPDDYNKAADILADMKVLADSVDGNIEQINSNIQENTENIKLSQEEIKKLQSENIEVKAENERLKSDIESISLVGEANGESIDLNDSSNARFNKFEIYGNHKQETRTGKNHFFTSTSSSTTNGITYTPQADKSSIIVDGTATDNATKWLIVDAAPFKLEAGSYVLSSCGTCDNSIYIGLGGKTSSGAEKFNITEKGTAVSFNINEDVYLNCYIQTVSGTQIENKLIKIMIVKAGVDYQNYESYGAMPSPDFPSEIKTVKDSVEVKVVNKNLYDAEKYPFVKRIAYNSKGVLSYWNGYCGIEKFFPVSENSQYVFSNSLNMPFYCIVYYDNNKNQIKVETEKKAIFTTPEKCRYVRFTIQKEEIPIWVQIKRGSTATDFVEHQEQAITMPVQQEMLKGDYFDFDREKEVHVMKKLVLQGIETENRWSVVGNTETEWRFLISAEGILRTLSSTEIANIICNKLKTTSSDNTYLKETGISGDDKYDAMIIYIEECKEMTMSEFNVYLKQQYDAGTPFIIYYKLATPIEFDFTDEQKAVAKQIKETLHTYKNVTHIYSDDEISPIVNVEYAKDLNTTISNIQALVLNNASEEVSG